MKAFIPFVVVIVLALLFSSPAVADTDYRCLNQCVRDGKTSTACMSECTYMPAHAFRSNDSKNNTTDNHNPLATPQPVGEDTLLEPKAPTALPKAKDYVCMATCQKNGMQSELCEKKCTKPDLTPVNARPGQTGKPQDNR